MARTPYIICQTCAAALLAPGCSAPASGSQAHTESTLPEGAGGTTPVSSSGGSSSTPGAGGTLVDPGAGGSQAVSAGGGVATGGSGGTASSGGAGSSDGTGGTTEFPLLEECDDPSVDRIKDWKASSKGVGTVPATGSMLVQEGGEYLARGSFFGGGGNFVVSLGNQWNAEVDLSDQPGFTLTYSATADFRLHLRPFFDWSGANKWHLDIPSTNGAVETAFFPFDTDLWYARAHYPAPPNHTLEEALAGATAFFFGGAGPNELAFYGLRIGSYIPDCSL